MKYLLLALERIFWESRLFIFLAVLSGIIATFVLVVLGTFDAYYLVKDFIHAFGHKAAMLKLGKYAVLRTTNMAQLFLAASMILIISYGIYQLFVGQIARLDTDPRSPKGLAVTNLEQFRDKLVKIIHIILIIVFFKYALVMKFSNVNSLAYLAGGIFLIAGSVYLVNKK